MYRYLCVNSTPCYLRPPLRGHANYIILSPWSRYLCVNSTPCYLRPPLRGQQNYGILFPKHIYLCVNGTPYHLRPPLWGQQNCGILFPEYRYLCVNSAPHYLRPPLRGLKLVLWINKHFHRLSLELLFHCGSMQNQISLFPGSRYLCVNSAILYLCPTIVETVKSY